MHRTILLLKFTAFVVLSNVCNHSLINPSFYDQKNEKRDLLRTQNYQWTVTVANLSFGNDPLQIFILSWTN